MRRMTRTGLVAALENEELQNNETPNAEEAAQDVEVAEASAELSDDVAEVTDTQAEGEADQAEVDEAVEVAEALESIAEAVGVAAQNGGLNQHAANAIGIAVQHMYNRVGLEARAMPALESFGSASQRISSTTLAMEDIKEKAGQIWQHIVDAVKRAIKWAVDFYNKIFGAAEKLARRAEALQGKAENLTGKAKESTFENDSVLKRLHKGGKVGGVPAELVKMEGVAKHVFGDSTMWATDLGKSIVESMEKEGAEKTFIADFDLPAGGMVGSAVSNAEGLGFTTPAEGLTLYRSEEMLGGMAIVGYGASSALKGEAAVAAFSAGGSSGVGQKTAVFDPKAKAPSNAKIPVLQTREMIDICKKVTNLADAIKKFRDTQSKANEMKKSFEKAATAMSKKTAGADEAAREGFRAMAKVAGKLPSFVDQPSGSFSAYLINTCKASLDYVDASMKQYSTKD